MRRSCFDKGKILFFAAVVAAWQVLFGDDVYEFSGDNDDFDDGLSCGGFLDFCTGEGGFFDFLFRGFF